MVNELGTDTKSKAGVAARRLRMTRGMSLEDRRNLNYVMYLNNKFHKLQPYFDLIYTYYWDIM